MHIIFRTKYFRNKHNDYVKETMICKLIGVRKKIGRE